MITRRRFVQAAAATALLPLRLPLGPPSPALEIGVQLYVVREAMRAAPDATLARLSALGFRSIEWWGRWPEAPSRWRARFDAHGVASPSVHVELQDLQPEALDATLDGAAAMGQESVLLAWTPPEVRASLAQYRAMAGLLNRAGRAAAQRGMRVGYHNHDFDTTRLDRALPLELLLDATDPATVCFELDCYWAASSGLDPLALLQRYPARFRLLHLKDAGPAPAYQMRDVGDGTLPWARLLERAQAQGVSHAFVEHDTPLEPWASIARSRAYLRTIGY